MSRFFSPLPLRTNLFYNPNIFLVLVAVFSIVKCHDEVRYTPAGCDKITTVNSNCNATQFHTFSEEFFVECSKRLQAYDISLEPSPLMPDRMCLLFPELRSEIKLCILITDRNRRYFIGMGVTLLIILILDVIGIGLIIYSCCCEKHPPPPPPPPAENSRNQPTVIMIQQGGAAPARKDEEA